MRYIIAKKNDIVHYAQLEANQDFATAMPVSEYDSFDEWITALNAEGIDTSEIDDQFSHSLERMKNTIVSDLERKVMHLERKIERLTSENTLTTSEEPEIPYENGIEVKAGDIVVENGKKYEVLQPKFTAQESYRPSLLHDQQGNRTLWREIPSTENPCTDAPVWNTNNWNDYGVGYQVKSNNAIWEATNTTHTWIEPALDGNGAISWKHIKDCN